MKPDAPVKPRVRSLKPSENSAGKRAKDRTTRGDGDGLRFDQPLRFERRREHRELVEPQRDGSRPVLSGTYTDGESRFGILHMEVVDQSRCGLGVRSRTRVEPGMRVTICPMGSSIPWLNAVAVRCEDEAVAEGDAGGGVMHRIGLSLSPRIAA